MVGTANFDLPHVQVAQSGREESINETFVALDALLAGVVRDVAVAVPPGAASEGDMWAVPATATGLWAGQGGNLALYIGGGWVFKSPPASMKFYDENSGLEFTSTGADWVGVSVTGSIEDLGVTFFGTPTASQVIWFESIGRGLTIPADFAGSSGSVGVNPTASVAIDVQVNGGSIGTITVSPLGVFTFVTATGLDVVIAAGARLQLVAPASADATISDIAFTMVGTTDGVAYVETLISSTRWRLMENAGCLGNTPSFAEFEMMTAVGGATITTGGTPSAQSEYDAGQTATQAFDGLSTTWWAAAAHDVPAWIEYEFAASVAIVEIAITARSDSNYNLAPKDFELQYYDGAAWQTILTKTGESAWSSSQRRTYAVQ